MKLSSTQIGYLAMLIAILGFGSGPTFVKMALSEYLPFDILAGRFFLAFFLLFIIALIFKVNLSLKKIGAGPLLMGILNPFLVTISFHVGLLLTNPVNAVAIISMLPIIQPFVAKLFLKEKIEIKVLIGVTITIMGTYLLISTQQKLGNGNYIGDLLIFLGIVCVSANEVLGRKIMKKNANPLTVSAYQYLISCVLSCLILLIIWPKSNFNFNDSFVISWPFLAIIYLAIQTFYAYIAYNFALRNLPIGKISLMYPLTGPIGATLSWLILGQEITIIIFVSLIVILIGTTVPYINLKKN